MKFRNKWWAALVIGVTLAAFVALGAISIWQSARASVLSAEVTAHYEGSFREISEHISRIKTASEKCAFAANPAQLSALGTEVFSAASAGGAALSFLPLSEYNLDTLHKYLAQVGEYSQTLSKKSVSGLAISEEEKAALSDLARYSGELYEALLALETRYESEQMGFLGSGEPKKLSGEPALPCVQEALSVSAGKLHPYGALNYNGRFSDGEDACYSPFLAGQKSLDSAEALRAAAKVLALPESALTRTGSSGGNPLCYSFSGGDKTVDISVKGGFPALYFAGGVGKSELTLSDALDKAAQFLKDCGFSDMSLAYYSVSDGRLHAVFCYSEQGVICYSDRITIGVSLSDGTVRAMSASAYLMNHKEGRSVAPKMDAASAGALLPAGLNRTFERLCVIPSEGNGELLCYEFLCEKGSARVLYFINAETGVCESVRMINESAHV